MFSYVDLEQRVPATHRLRTIRTLVNDVIGSLDAAFDALYENTGWESIAPERLLRASLLQAFYSIRSERQLMERIDYNLLFRWFVGLGVDDPVWDHSAFSKSRDRLLDADVAAKVPRGCSAPPRGQAVPVGRAFPGGRHAGGGVASMKSVRAKNASDEPPDPGRNIDRDFHGRRRGNDTRASTTDPEAKLYKKAQIVAAAR